MGNYNMNFFHFASDNAHREFPQMIAQQAERLRNGAEPNLPRQIVTICGWCLDHVEQTAAARAQGFEVSHGLCPACGARINVALNKEPYED